MDREPGLHPFCLNPARGKPAFISTLNLRFSKRITNDTDRRVHVVLHEELMEVLLTAHGPSSVHPGPISHGSSLPSLCRRGDQVSKQVSVWTSTATKGACGATLGPAAAPGPKLAPTGQQDVCPESPRWTSPPRSSRDTQCGA